MIFLAIKHLSSKYSLVKNNFTRKSSIMKNCSIKEMKATSKLINLVIILILHVNDI